MIVWLPWATIAFRSFCYWESEEKWRIFFLVAGILNVILLVMLSAGVVMVHGGVVWLFIGVPMLSIFLNGILTGHHGFNMSD